MKIDEKGEKELRLVVFSSVRYPCIPVYTRAYICIRM